MKVAVFLLCLLPLAFCAPSDIDKRWLINGRCLQIIFVKQKIQKKTKPKTNKQTNKENLNNNKIEQHIQTNQISKQKRKYKHYYYKHLDSDVEIKWRTNHKPSLCLN